MSLCRTEQSSVPAYYQESPLAGQYKATGNIVLDDGAVGLGGTQDVPEQERRIFQSPYEFQSSVKRRITMTRHQP